MFVFNELSHSSDLVPVQSPTTPVLGTILVWIPCFEVEIVLKEKNYLWLISSKVITDRYTVKEVGIPTNNSYIAGKLWQGVGETDTKELPIVCIHGWLDNANTFDPLLSLIMKPGRTCYAFDLPGHGKSPLSSRGYFDGFAEFLMAINRVMTEFKWNKIVLIGHSMGSVLSFSFSGIFPEFVAGYVGLDIVRSVPRNHIDSIRRLAYGITKIEKKLAEQAGPPTYSYDEILQRTYNGRKESVNLEGCKILLERGAIALPNNKYRFSHDIRVTVPASIPIPETVSEEMAKNLKCPVCIIKGDPGEYYEPKENFDSFIDFMRQNVSDFEFHYAPGTHHFHLNDPQPVAPIITQFLDLKVNSKTATDSRNASSKLSR
ncbi:unnamed protein product [Allacma fusca]|uniref:AB hydrolase-1 domain-containing protein n=1 Tax=Allacma fusca TaxID=39272 RepID=A0A8J2KAR0_9HEXA|nr:unnamed protein product [Allacma fusca]